MNLPIFQVDAFSGSVFRGNPAAVVPLRGWLSDPCMQAIAAENNLSETAFLVPHSGTRTDRTDRTEWDLRWFTPRIEMNLCGHATLASARCVLDHLAIGSREVSFHTRSGELVVSAEGSTLRMDFPSQPPSACDPAPDLEHALGNRPREVLCSSSKYLAIFDTEAEVRAIVPDAGALMELDLKGLIASAPATDKAEHGVDFVSRYFAPKVGILEDPVTGSAHCVSTPYWAKRLGKRALRAQQISERGGELWCEDHGERVSISGEAVTYLVGEITIPD